MRRLLFTLLLIALAAVSPLITLAQEQKRDARAKELYEKGNGALTRGEFDSAMSAIEEALKVEPSWAELHLKLGIASLFKFVQTRDPVFEIKARQSLTRATELNPSLAEPYYYLGLHFSAKRDYEQAIRFFEKAIGADPFDTKSLVAKWETQLRKAEFEQELPAIRGEIESLIARNAKEKSNRAEVLLAAAKGYSLIGDDEARGKVETLFEAEFPERPESAQILYRRALAETNKGRQADLMEELFARHPSTRQWPLYAMAFRARAAQPDVSGERLLKLGREWVASAGEEHYAKITATSSVVAALAERRLQLAEAGALAEDAVRVVTTLSPDLVKGAGTTQEEKGRFINFLSELAHRSKGFVLLKQGRTDEASKELEAALKPVIETVEKNGYVLWKDTDLREVGARPRVLWLAELYEARGDFERAAKFLLAGIGDDEPSNRYISHRMLDVYKRLGRGPDRVAADISEAERRYKSLLTPSTSRKDEERKVALANRANTPAPDFQLTTLNKRVIRLSEMKGKVVVLNFWATWCGPCVIEMPHFQRAAQRYSGNSKVVFVAITIDSNRALVGPFLKRIGYTELVAYDNGAADGYGIASIPTTVVIDRNAVIRYRDVGFGGAAETYIERLSWRIDDLLKSEGGDTGSKGGSNEE